MLPSVTLGRSLTGPELLSFPHDSRSADRDRDRDGHRDDDNTKHSETTDPTTQRVSGGRKSTVDNGHT
jgi:hypothetical protein